MTNILRHAVSKQKKRFKKDGFDLDLAYITPRIIAMGFPSEKAEGLYRNPIKDVYKFFEKYHKGHYKLYNLCAERKYDPSRFHNRVSQYPFEDHNAPPLDLIVKCCKDIEDWLSADKDNVVGINCKAGKGRTGLIICCFLLHSKQCPDSTVALKFYGEQRTKDGKGVTIASQQRYIRYYEEILRLGSLPEIKALFLNTITIHSPPQVNGDIYAIVIIKGQEIGYSSKASNSMKTEKNTLDLDFKGKPIHGDVKIQFCAKRKGSPSMKLCHLWINTSFFDKEYKSTLLKGEIDVANKDKKCLVYSSDFKVEVICSPVTTSDYKEIGLRSSKNNTTTTTPSSPDLGSEGSLKVCEKKNRMSFYAYSDSDEENSDGEENINVE
eukprot:TRINITY_DN8186_c0_g1_i2.p1 TRINITY_DN8186_c0_g1~~TRINITY_DN8186_c0_g1_i2.p1  ORF type:complete len:393 (-),score=66.04 TRINITY_DN8186_c0_g1_i2:7-1146(-)